MGECPASEMLQGLLDQSLPEALQKEIESHVEHCPGCAEILENLTKGVGGVLFPLAACIRPDQLHSEPVPPTSLPSIQNYEIRAELGRGGMAVVYKAWHVPLKRTVALKMILGAGHLDPERRARFRTEAESVARLQHPNIVQIFDIGEHAGRPFLALEFVEGGSLAKKLAGQPQPVQETAKTVETLARAIHHAHQKGVIHRDLKPANVLVNTDGRQMITDFGLAQAADEPARLRDGTIIGTAEYMAPEQAAGQFSSVGPSTDVYALGVILYEMLVGRPPFRGQTPPDTLEQVQTLDPVPPRHQQPKVPRDLETICLKCLEKEPHRRYGTAEALADDLDLFRSGKPIQARPTGPLTRSWKWCKRNPSGALAILSLVVGFLVSAVLAGIAWEQATVAKQQKAKAVRNAFLRLVTLNDVLEIAAG
ncbi:MAG TPA: protein kinase, partial [Gemmataceae bacterium]|nr:protein kinase [Gemmataceae bacterium]